jgi:hypothetical protein
LASDVEEEANEKGADITEDQFRDLLDTPEKKMAAYRILDFLDPKGSAGITIENYQS